jgi:transcriptional regulator with XRE-family HTH domain
LQPTAEWLTQPGGLAQRLRAMRTAAGLTGDQLASRLGWSRSRVPKIENGHQMPSDQDVLDWVAACGQPDEAADELLALLSQGQTLHRQWRQRLRHGHAAVQTEWDALIRKASVVRNFEIVLIPGLLQTPEYVRQRMIEAVRNYGAAEDGVDAAVAARLRRQEVLYESGHRFEFAVSEAALRIGAAPAAVMIGQLDRLSVLSGLPNIKLGIIPLGVPLPAMQQNPFIVLDDVVFAETHGSLVTVRGSEADTYKRIADALMAEAVTGDHARRLCMSAVEWWQAQGRPD